MADELCKEKCPSCGKELQIPTELTEYSCVYCGARTKKASSRTVDCTAAEALKEVKSRIMETIVGKRELRKEIKKEQYDLAFRDYEALCRPIFNRLDDACLAAGEEWEPVLDELVADFMQQLENHWNTEGSASKRKFAQEDDKITIAIFLVPAVQHLDLASGEEFCQRLQAAWVARYPQTPFHLGSYETISGGFRNKRFGLCFITTAVCKQEGKPDDCAELVAFRAFRDGYLSACPDGPALIQKYYRVAPSIVTIIDLCTDSQAVYGEIREKWLGSCYEALQKGCWQACKADYTDMVETLERRYLN